MRIEACLICDSASDYQGHLCILGAFDTIVAGQVPALHPHSALVIRVRFEKSEEGQHPFRILMVDADGKPNGPKIEGTADIQVPPNAESYVSNLIININGLPLPNYGSYEFDFVLDGREVASVPLTVTPPPQNLRRAA